MRAWLIYVCAHSRAVNAFHGRDSQADPARDPKRSSDSVTLRGITLRARAHHRPPSQSQQRGELSNRSLDNERERERAKQQQQQQQQQQRHTTRFSAQAIIIDCAPRPEMFSITAAGSVLISRVRAALARRHLLFNSSFYTDAATHMLRVVVRKFRAEFTSEQIQLALLRFIGQPLGSPGHPT